jgi:hypothetical protein
VGSGFSKILRISLPGDPEDLIKRVFANIFPGKARGINYSTDRL